MSTTSNSRSGEPDEPENDRPPARHHESPVALSRPLAFRKRTHDSLPIVLGMAVRTLSGVIDTAMIGRLNEAATSIGRSLGQKQPELAERNRWESLKIGATFMGVPGVTFLVFPEPILRTLSIRKTSYGPG